MFLLFYVVSRVGVTDPDVDVSSHYFVLRVGVTVSGCFFSLMLFHRVGVTDPDVDVSSLYVVSRVGVTDPDDVDDVSSL